MKFKGIYVEITNVCNLNCSFCVGTNRPKAFMTSEEFAVIAKKVKPFTDYVHLHVLGEPLLNTDLEKILEIAQNENLKVNITTNGLLLPQKKETLLAFNCVNKVAISIHSYHDNGLKNERAYLEEIWDFCQRAKCNVELRLWNGGDDNLTNKTVFDFLTEKLDKDILTWPKINNARRLGEKLYLLEAERFDWPSTVAPKHDVHYCYGLLRQLGILVDGTVVPCCLDAQGDISLGNIFNEDLADILASEKCVDIRNGFNKGTPTEELCKHCGYATRFSTK